MAARVTIEHDDLAFLTQLSAALRNEGYEVESFAGLGSTAGPPRVMDKLEITITRATGTRAGIRVRVTGLPAGLTFAGSVAQFLAEPVTIQDVVAAVRQFGAP